MLVFILTMVSTFFLIVAIGIFVPMIKERSKESSSVSKANKTAVILSFPAFASEMVSAKVAEVRGSAFVVIDNIDLDNEIDEVTFDMNAPKVSGEFRPEFEGRPAIATYVF